MDPKLKTYLKGVEGRLNKRLGGIDKRPGDLEKKIEDKTTDILEVVRSTGDNTSRIITK
ncbi:MAG: hypothetical protein UY24_C0017G0012 [Parcubacteria group bacterium GW2011_GWA1_48_11b]|nr:MAG: hypothetical protein UY24_C0017G0012 [Parcubacteria group bacterium GW2011_GWA1_48_11b]